MSKNSPKLYLNMIIGDFEPVEIVKRSINSVKDYVDGKYITVTYKKKKPSQTDSLILMLNQMGVNISYFKWVDDFSIARQYALDQVPKTEDSYIYWQDSDDILQGGEFLRPLFLEALKNKWGGIYFDYLYQVDIDEKTNEIREVLVTHRRERIVKNDGTWEWKGSLHETLIEQKQENLVKIYRPECKVVHLSDNSRMDVNIDRNVKILEESLRKENGKDPRTSIYLAKAYFDKAKMSEGADRKIFLDLALHLFHDYLEGVGDIGSKDYREPSGWADERATAYSYIGEIAIIMENPDIAISAFESAIDESPFFPNYYINLAMAYVMKNDFKKAKHWLNLATSFDSPDTTLIIYPRELKTRALEVAYQIDINEGKLDNAVVDVEKLIEILPNEQELKDRLLKTRGLRDFNKACQSVVFLGKYLEASNQTHKMKSLIDSMPDEMQREPFASEMRHKFFPPKKWGDDEITILCGPGFEEWSPYSVNTGLGGSEEAVVYLSQELRKLGWKVTVYANPGKLAGDFEGVEYRPYYEFNVNDEFSGLILWRGIGFADIKPKAKFTVLWLHDVPSNPDFTEERLKEIDKIAVLSEYHKSLLRVMEKGEFKKPSDDKVFLTANGIPEIKIPDVKRNPHRMIYASSPDRGLIYLLKNWDKIIKEVPDAELHVFYGFDVFDVMYKNNPAMQSWKEQIMVLMKQPGIFYHGRIGHEELNKEYAKSAIWAYPTHFTEISCISAMRAQTLGAIPVTTTLAALDETVKNGIKLDADIIEEESQKEYVQNLVDLLKDEKKQEEIRGNMMAWAKEYFLWKNVAIEWSDLFKQKIKS
jgi:glycosyltransferase involved in cell wall biosynthesis